VETLQEYLERLSSHEPTPGGGSAAALVAALGAALCEMAGRIADVPPDLLSRAQRLRADALAARERDERAFAAVIAAQALPKSNDAEKAARRDALETALHGAAAEPLHAASIALDVLRLSRELAQMHTGALASDIGCAAEFAAASLAACAYNVRINHRYMKDEAAIRAQSATLEPYENEAARIVHDVRGLLAQGRLAQGDK